jgi:hypothetical protein
VLPRDRPPDVGPARATEVTGVDSAPGGQPARGGAADVGEPAPADGTAAGEADADIAQDPGKARKTDRSTQQMDSYDVRFWDIKKLGNGTAARHRVRAFETL